MSGVKFERKSREFARQKRERDDMVDGEIIADGIVFLIFEKYSNACTFRLLRTAQNRLWFRGKREERS